MSWTLLFFLVFSFITRPFCQITPRPTRLARQLTERDFGCSTFPSEALRGRCTPRSHTATWRGEAKRSQRGQRSARVAAAAAAAAVGRARRSRTTSLSQRLSRFLRCQNRRQHLLLRRHSMTWTATGVRIWTAMVMASMIAWACRLRCSLAKSSTGRAISMWRACRRRSSSAPLRGYQWARMGWYGCPRRS